MAWAYLLAAGVLEVAFTTTLRYLVRREADLWLNLAFLGLVVGSFHCLQAATRSIPIGTAYAVWTGIRAVGTVLVGGLFFGESTAPVRLALIGLIVAAVVGLKVIEA